MPKQKRFNNAISNCRCANSRGNNKPVLPQKTSSHVQTHFRKKQTNMFTILSQKFLKVTKLFGFIEVNNNENVALKITQTIKGFS